MKPDNNEENHIVLGRINGLHGVKGWVKIFSYSRPRENIFTYTPWTIKIAEGSWSTHEVNEWKPQSKGLIARIEGVNDRDEAQAFVGKDITISRDQLPALENDEYYWCDLIGMEVANQAGDTLGNVVQIEETGANDVLVVKGQKRYLIPLLKGTVIKQVDLAEGRMLVDWDDEYI